MSDKKTWPIKNADKGQYETVDIIEAVARRCSVKKVILQISQNSKENTSARVSLLIKLQS